MSILETFERKALFNITRAVALLCVTFVLIGVIGVGFYGASVLNKPISTKVSAQEIVGQLKGQAPTAAQSNDQPSGIQPPVEQGPGKSPLAGYRIPFALQKYITGDNARILKNHLDEVPAEDRQAYLDELGAVVVSAEQNKIDAFEAINAYVKTKAERYTHAAMAKAERETKMKIVGAVFASGLLFIALFSLVLVLLAIERNTRGTGHAA